MKNYFNNLHSFEQFIESKFLYIFDSINIILIINRKFKIKFLIY